MKQKHLITGAAGFIGANLLRRLLKKNQEVHILTRPDSNKWRLEGILGKVFEHTLDTPDSKSLTRTLKKINPDYIYHLSAFGGYPFQKDVETMIKVNILFTSRLLEAANEINYRAFILTGSSSEYGYKYKSMKENDYLEPASFYAATKAGMTHLAQVFGRSFHKPIIVVRPFSVYGPFEEPSRLVPTVIMNCLKNKDVLLTTGREKRDFIFIEDFLDCFLTIAQNPEKASGQVINIGSGVQSTTREIVTSIHKLTNSKSRLLWGKYPRRSWDTKFWLADISLAKKIFNWMPKHNLEEGIKETILWFENNPRVSHFYLPDSPSRSQSPPGRWPASPRGEPQGLLPGEPWQKDNLPEHDSQKVRNSCNRKYYEK